MKGALASGAVLLSLSLANAPFQCGRGHDPALAREDSPGDALYALAQELDSTGDHAAADRTYRYLIEHYPSSRHTPAARERLKNAPAMAAPTSPDGGGT